MDKNIFIRILIGKEKEKEKDILKLISKEEYKELKKTFKRIKPALDRLGKKECTDKDIRKFIKLIEENHCRECKYKKQVELFCIDFSLPEDYYGTDEYNEE